MLLRVEGIGKEVLRRICCGFIFQSSTCRANFRLRIATSTVAVPIFVSSAAVTVKGETTGR